ncbi:MAG TPA: ABC transporter ATP-binding protein [Candidatus Eisenbacteria bacterium]|nr:ABC transporter ATP-binding protein [Candidatus Eisenbacteria bacterium]
MQLKIPSRADAQKLLANGWWAVNLIWSTSPGLTLGLALATLGRGLVPAGLAIFARGLINAFVSDGAVATVTFESVAPWLVLGFGVTVVEALAPLTARFCTDRLHDDVNIRITSDVLAHAEQLEPIFFEDPHNRNLLDRAQQSPADRFMRFIAEAQNSLTHLLQTVFLGAILVVIEPLIVLVLAPFALPYLFFHWRLSKRRYDEEYRRTPQRRWTGYFVSLLTGRESLAEVRLLNLSPFLRGKFAELMTRFRNIDRALYWRSFAGSSLFALVTTAAFYLIFIRVIMKVMNGVLTVGDIAVFGAATSRLRFSLELAIRSLTGALEQTLYIANLIEFFRQKPAPRRASGTLQPACRGEIRMKNVSFTYPGSATAALRDVSLHVRAGETLAIVGENGAGKTTLVKLIARLYEPGSGSIEFDGIDAGALSTAYLQKHIGFVFQDFARYEATAGENIAYGDWQRLLGKQREIEEIARLSGVDQLIAAMPSGYDTQLGRLFGKHDLSRGQWQKLAIARAFARDAAVLILDEPAASLSVQAEYELFCRFRELSRGRTTILISHRFSTLSIADRIVVLDKGTVVECGTHQELLARGGLYARLYRLHRHPLKSMATDKNARKIVPLK